MPPPPTVIVIELFPPFGISIFLKPPAPPPPDPPPDAPPPATIKLCIVLVPGCVVTDPEDVLTVCLLFPNEALFVTPIIPPFVLGIVSSYADTQAVPFQS